MFLYLYLLDTGRSFTPTFSWSHMEATIGPHPKVASQALNMVHHPPKKGRALIFGGKPFLPAFLTSYLQTVTDRVSPAWSLPSKNKDTGEEKFFFLENQSTFIRYQATVTFLGRPALPLSHWKV